MPNTPHHMLTEDCWKLRFVNWCEFSCAKECKYLVLVIAYPVNGASFVTGMLGRICGHDCGPLQIVHGWYDLQLKGVVLFGGDSSRNHHSAWFFIPLLVLHESFRKFFVCLHLRSSISPCHGCAHSALTHGKKPFSLRILCMASSVPQCG
jgi:hypothetical protein